MFALHILLTKIFCEIPWGPWALFLLFPPSPECPLVPPLPSRLFVLCLEVWELLKSSMRLTLPPCHEGMSVWERDNEGKRASLCVQVSPASSPPLSLRSVIFYIPGFFAVNKGHWFILTACSLSLSPSHPPSSSLPSNPLSDIPTVLLSAVKEQEEE